MFGNLRSYLVSEVRTRGMAYEILQSPNGYHYKLLFSGFGENFFKNNPREKRDYSGMRKRNKEIGTKWEKLYKYHKK